MDVQHAIKGYLIKCIKGCEIFEYLGVGINKEDIKNRINKGKNII